ncbi:UNVERIFIED_CONTAM: hypothetical protein Sradi_6778700 [Sesamum radiatum]|uniref:Uncharacterized protein n=1 Tax=Sesamum radiatum TaxID=300843 RepID=A0AAW2JUT8_SESRA
MKEINSKNNSDLRRVRDNWGKNFPSAGLNSGGYGAVPGPEFYNTHIHWWVGSSDLHCSVHPGSQDDDP